MTLSPRHIQVRDFIIAYQAEHNGEPPSQKTVYLALGLKQHQVSRYMKRLRKSGELNRPGYEAPKARRVGV